MEGSSESHSRRLNSFRVSDRNTDSGDASRDLGFRKDSDIASARIDYLSSHFEARKVCNDELEADPFVRTPELEDVSFRQWLDRPERSVDVFECLHIFRQIVEIVNIAHSQGIVVNNVRPSCFVMSSFNHVSFIESASCSDSGSDSMEEGPNSQPVRTFQHMAKFDRGDLQLGMPRINSLSRDSLLNDEKMETFPMKQILVMESSWYTSPEEDADTPSTCASDVYRLGVLLFELFCPVNSREDKARTMSSLRHRVLPPQLLLKWPKEASFCLWLLHPDPSSRPTIGELLESEFLIVPKDDFEEREAAIELRERLDEQELLLEFLFLIQQGKLEAADKLQEKVSFLCSDIEEVMKQQLVLKTKGGSCTKFDDDQSASGPRLTCTSENEEPSVSTSRKRFREAIQMSASKEYDDSPYANQENVLLSSSRLMKHFKKLESVYFSARCRQIEQPGKLSARQTSASSDGRGSIMNTDRSSISSLAFKDRSRETKQGGWINPFLEGLCKYLSFSKLRVKADLKQGDLLNSSNLVCSIGFDRDGELFATAGVNKKIKVFECDAIMNESQDIHYPVVEMASGSKLSSICWNSYIKGQIASSNFEGVVQVWDATRSQLLMEMRDHEKRVWSVDFSSADPTLLASGSDDGSVKLWSINQGVSIGTIKTKANVCCVQFPLDSGRYLAFGSADHKVYYYDLRNPKIPLCTLIGHNKTVSYVKFVDATTMVSSSTDNTLKLWDLSVCPSGVNDSPLHSFTGHTNVKNFVGLSVSDGYIATGSETNEVFLYHKSFPMPALSFKFNNPDPVSGLEMDDSSQFISSVCWRGQSSTLVAANSTGNIKILEMV